jgi:RimJ/RimL family protein N-acetyltransferase/SAM-dependent methyltransferase
MADLALRPMAEGDRECLLAWRNDPFIVARSSSRRLVTPQEHAEWFARALSTIDMLPFIVERVERPIGHVRFERVAADTCVITAYLLPGHTGHGLGVQAIHLGCEAARKCWPAIRIVACVREDNAAGRSGFRKAGFLPGAGECPEAHECLVLDGDHDEQNHTAEHYRQLLEEHGTSHLALDWGSRESQRLRFEVLATVGNLSGRRILDVGCGLGDFAGWLDERGIDADYTGIDLTPELVTQAALLHPHRRFECGGILDASVLSGERFDYVLASGIFATYLSGSEDFLRRAVARMWQLAERGCAFNSLSTWAPTREAGEYHADPLAVLEYCRSLTPWLALRHDYHPRDFSIYLWREQAA